MSPSKDCAKASPCAAAIRSQRTASASSSRRREASPSSYCAKVSPCSAAIRSQRTASASSSGTPLPLRYMPQSKNCALVSPCSAARRSASRSSCAEIAVLASRRLASTARVVPIQICLGTGSMGFNADVSLVATGSSEAGSSPAGRRLVPAGRRSLPARLTAHTAPGKCWPSGCARCAIYAQAAP